MIKKVIDLLKVISFRDFLLVFGLGLMGYGLYLFIPWLSFVITGALVLLAGLFMGEKK